LVLELLGVSQISISQQRLEGFGVFSQLKVKVHSALGKKCDRCWRFTEDIGHEGKYPTVCGRCAEALDAIDYPPYAATNDE